MSLGVACRTNPEPVVVVPEGSKSSTTSTERPAEAASSATGSLGEGLGDGDGPGDAASPGVRDRPSCACSFSVIRAWLAAKAKAATTPRTIASRSDQRARPTTVRGISQPAGPGGRPEPSGPTPSSRARREGGPELGGGRPEGPPVRG